MNFLPPYKAEHSFLDPNIPMSVGTLADPDYYFEARHDMQLAMERSIPIFLKKLVKSLKKNLEENMTLLKDTNVKMLKLY